MYWQTALCLGFLVFGIGLIAAGFLVGWKYMVQKKRCTARTDGLVVGYSKVVRGGEGSSVHLPIVEYVVNQKFYHVVGPEYRAYLMRKSGASKEEEESQPDFSPDVYKQVFTCTVQKTAILERGINPMESLFPQGSRIRVYYDPDRPAFSYVLRYCDCRILFFAPVILGVIDILADLLLYMM